MADMIHMTHPTVEGVATATEQAFEQVWKPKGWVLADDADIAAAERAELAQALGVAVEDLPAEEPEPAATAPHTTTAATPATPATPAAKPHTKEA